MSKCVQPMCLVILETLSAVKDSNLSCSSLKVHKQRLSTTYRSDMVEVNTKYLENDLMCVLIHSLTIPKLVAVDLEVVRMWWLMCFMRFYWVESQVMGWEPICVQGIVLFFLKILKMDFHCVLQHASMSTPRALQNELSWTWPMLCQPHTVVLLV